jgi:hypothetical protein
VKVLSSNPTTAKKKKKKLFPLDGVTINNTIPTGTSIQYSPKANNDKAPTFSQNPVIKTHSEPRTHGPHLL